MSSALVAPHHRSAAATLARIFAADFLQMQQTPFQSPAPRPSPPQAPQARRGRTAANSQQSRQKVLQAVQLRSLSPPAGRGQSGREA
jgi:hypothetical protein